MATYPTAAVDRLNGYNGERYNAQTNALGFAIGGHRVNFVSALRDTAAVGAFVAAASQEAKDSAQAALNSAQEATAARDLARRWASAAEDVEVIPGSGIGSALHYAQKAAKSAAAAATFDPGNFMPLSGVHAMAGRLKLVPSNSSRASLVIPVGADEPSADTEDGGLWNSVSGLRMFLSGVFRTLWDTSNMPGVTDAEIDSGAGTTVKAWTVTRVGRMARVAVQPLLDAAVAAVNANKVTTDGIQQTIARKVIKGNVQDDLSGDFAGSELVLESLNRESVARLGFHVVGRASGALGLGLDNNLYWAVGQSVGLVWHANNDGAGSGLDADKLDGQEGAYFLDFANATGQVQPAQQIIRPDTTTGLGAVASAVWIGDPMTAYAATTVTVAGGELDDPVSAGSRFFGGGTWRNKGFNGRDANGRAIHNWQRVN